MSTDPEFCERIGEHPGLTCEEYDGRIRFATEAVDLARREAVLSALDELRAKVDGLKRHPISGYEWECDECEFWWSDDPRWGDAPLQSGRASDHDTAGNECDHQTLIDAPLVLTLIDASRSALETPKP